MVAEKKIDYHVVIIGGGFGGLYAARKLAYTDVKVTLVDKRNFHLFQPLLYQVATGELSPGDIASPFRTVFEKNNNINILNDELIDFDPERQVVFLKDVELKYDSLILATGLDKNYFNHTNWIEIAPGLKTVEDAIDIRSRVLKAFEEAEKETDVERRKELLTFVIIGGGATGVELSGALAEMAFRTFKNEFKNFNMSEVEILLIEGSNKILAGYSSDLSKKAEKKLQKRGVKILKSTLVKEIDPGKIFVESNRTSDIIKSRCIIWAAGIKGTPISNLIEYKTGASLDKIGRVNVNQDLTLTNFNNIYVIGDLAHFNVNDSEILPAIAPVAIQQGRYVAKHILARLNNKPILSFKYYDKGMLAVIGRNAAIAEFGKLKFSGFFAWLLWVFVHIAYLIEYDNKLIVLIQWAWNYFTDKRGTRLITNNREIDSEDHKSSYNLKSLKQEYKY